MVKKNPVSKMLKKLDSLKSFIMHQTTTSRGKRSGYVTKRKARLTVRRKAAPKSRRVRKGRRGGKRAGSKSQIWSNKYEY